MVKVLLLQPGVCEVERLVGIMPGMLGAQRAMLRNERKRPMDSVLRSQLSMFPCSWKSLHFSVRWYVCSSRSSIFQGPNDETAHSGAYHGGAYSGTNIKGTNVQIPYPSTHDKGTNVQIPNPSTHVKVTNHWATNTCTNNQATNVISNSPPKEATRVVNRSI
jgi:hypothetical protein